MVAEWGPFLNYYSEKEMLGMESLRDQREKNRVSDPEPPNCTFWLIYIQDMLV